MSAIMEDRIPIYRAPVRPCQKAEFLLSLFSEVLELIAFHSFPRDRTQRKPELQANPKFPGRILP